MPGNRRNECFYRSNIGYRSDNITTRYEPYLTEENLQEMLSFANAAVALITTRKGALRVMPAKKEVERILP